MKPYKQRANDKLPKSSNSKTRRGPVLKRPMNKPSAAVASDGRATSGWQDASATSAHGHRDQADTVGGMVRRALSSSDAPLTLRGSAVCITQSNSPEEFATTADLTRMRPF